MSALNEFVPRQNDETVRVIATHGDCLAVERMVDAKRSRAGDKTAINRLQGLEPVPQPTGVSPPWSDASGRPTTLHPAGFSAFRTQYTEIISSRKHR